MFSFELEDEEILLALRGKWAEQAEKDRYYAEADDISEKQGRWNAITGNIGEIAAKKMLQYFYGIPVGPLSFGPKWGPSLWVDDLNSEESVAVVGKKHELLKAEKGIHVKSQLYSQVQKLSEKNYSFTFQLEDRKRGRRADPLLARKLDPVLLIGVGIKNLHEYWKPGLKIPVLVECYTFWWPYVSCKLRHPKKASNVGIKTCLYVDDVVDDEVWLANSDVL